MYVSAQESSISGIAKSDKSFQHRGSRCALLSQVEYQCAAGVTPDQFCGISRCFIGMKP